jgi:2-oxoglutarate dehydrogenase E1 component
LEYVDQLWRQYKANPSSVSSDWRYFFEGVEFAGVAELGRKFDEKEWGVLRLIQAYRQYGYLEANLDPLVNSHTQSDLLRLSRYGLDEADIEKTFSVTQFFFGELLTLNQVVERLRLAYCGKLSVQCSEALPDIQAWFYEKLEKTEVNWTLTPDQKKSVFHYLSLAESFEKFLHSRFVGAKRFSIEGGESLLPMLEWLTESSEVLGLDEMVMGMAHRGRLTCLTRYFGKPVEQILTGFLPQDLDDLPFDDFDGDVKYHLGYRKERKTASGHKFTTTLAFNPSHLESVNTVVLGMARAAQRLRKDTKERSRVVPLLIHGDAAFAGQGIVQETLQMSQVKGYRVGGCVHVIVDNQVGFTTNPENSRSTPFSSDVAKIIQAPVIHVNGDDVESCVRAMDLALRFRQQWHRDVVINMVCYRRYGHNEGDEPSYTQPQMYKLIKSHPTPRELYQKRLVSESILTSEQIEAQWNQMMADLDQSLANVRAKPVYIEPYKFEGQWKGLRKATAQDFETPIVTGYSKQKLEQIGEALSQYPENFHPHPKLLKLLEQRAKVAKGEEMMDWGMGELLAFGSLLDQGYHVRLTGQDCVRGTFSHRHAGLYDVNTGECFMALKHRYWDKSEFCVYDSILSEYGVMGFEYGNSIWDPNFLSLWEAQFGDFSNGAQVIIDQFIASAESKWQQMSGLVLLLPHGYEGQGPEHSSARLERYLQLCAQNNMQVIVPTTPAQIFHAYRRQMLRPFRKPLIVMTPKSLLRHPKAVSHINDLAKGQYQEVIPDVAIKNPKDIETVILCSGKIYYDLEAEREKTKKMTTAIVRLEQLYPTPLKQIASIIKSYPKLKNIIWAQEEPKNMGAYQFIYFRLSEMLFKEGLTHLPLHYIGRGEKASPATGSPTRHKLEQEQIIKGCFSI